MAGALAKPVTCTELLPPAAILVGGGWTRGNRIRQRLDAHSEDRVLDVASTLSTPPLFVWAIAGQYDLGVGSRVGTVLALEAERFSHPSKIPTIEHPLVVRPFNSNL